MIAQQPFNWKSTSWKCILLKAFQKYLSSKEIDEIIRTEIALSGDASTIDNWYYKKSGKTIKFDEMLAKVLEHEFSGIQCYHCCRPIDLKSYLANGITPLQKEVAIEIARRIFVAANSRIVSEEAFAVAVGRFAGKNRESLSHFGLDDRFLITNCGHYLLYGSEYITGIAAALSTVQRGICDYRQLLKKYGTPTVFCCNIPFELIGSETLQELRQEIISNLFASQPDVEFTNEIDFTISISCQLAPTHILGYYHPLEIRDPLTGELWLNETN